MGFFSKILEKLGLRKGEDESTSTTPAKPIAKAGRPAGTSTTAKPSAPPPGVARAGARPAGTAVAKQPGTPVGKAAPTPISEVDVVAKLELLGAGTDLNWKVSIVDLLKLLDIDSSREARNELAEELGCPPELMSDSAKMNTWLHKTVLKKIAENGGNIPQSLLD